MAVVKAPKKARETVGNNGAKYKAFARDFLDQTKRLVNEASVDLRCDSLTDLNRPMAKSMMIDWFVENSYDTAYYADKPEELLEYKEDMRALAENDINVMTGMAPTETGVNNHFPLLEYTNGASVNPIVSSGLPMHKLMMMDQVFNKGVIQTHVTEVPKFTIEMIHRYLVTPDGKEYDLSLDQNKITDAFNSVNPYREVVLPIKHLPGSDAQGKSAVEQCGGVKGRDNLDVDTKITAIAVTVDGQEKWIDCELKFNPGYGFNDTRTLETKPLDVAKFVTTESTPNPTNTIVWMTGVFKDSDFMLADANGLATKVKIRTKLDSSNGLVSTCKGDWKSDETLVEIGTANPFSIPVSPEEIKDINALYSIDQLSMYMGIINDTLGNVKDDTIRRELLANFKTLPESQRFASFFDFKPEDRYNGDQVNWRFSTFMDVFDTFVGDLLTVLNDPDVTISVFGRPDLIRKLKPTSYTYESGKNIGPVPLEFRRAIYTSDDRSINFVSSQKFGGSNDLVVILNPNNSKRIIYRVYDYQFYLSNEIRDPDNPTLPAIHAFERFKFLAYQPVQGRFRILNPTGRDETTHEVTELVDAIRAAEI